MINQNEKVVLTMALPECQLDAGTIGIVLQVYPENESYTVGYFTADGRTVTVMVDESQIRPISNGEQQRVAAIS